MPARRMTTKTRIFEISVVLQGVRPPVRRLIQVPHEMTLAELHEVVQVAMGWTDSHLHEFEADGVRYGPPDPDGDEDTTTDSASARLFRLVGPGGRLGYVYDFGDSWTHTLTVEKVVAPEAEVRYPRCLSGRRACPPEDIGGTGGYTDFLEVVADPTHPEHHERVEWAGGTFDPAAFDLAEVNEALAPLAWRAGVNRAG